MHDARPADSGEVSREVTGRQQLLASRTEYRCIRSEYLIVHAASRNYIPLRQFRTRYKTQFSQLARPNQEFMESPKCPISKDLRPCGRRTHSRNSVDFASFSRLSVRIPCEDSTKECARDTHTCHLVVGCCNLLQRHDSLACNVTWHFPAARCPRGA